MGVQTEEVCILVPENNKLNIPNKILLEDNFGLWYLDQDKLISMTPAKKSDLPYYFGKKL